MKISIVDIGSNAVKYKIFNSENFELLEYYREPLTYGLKNVSPYQDTRDQLRYREDITEGIVYNQNKQSWGKLWYPQYSTNNPGPDGKTTWSYKA